MISRNRSQPQTSEVDVGLAVGAVVEGESYFASIDEVDLELRKVTLDVVRTDGLETSGRIHSASSEFRRLWRSAFSGDRADVSRLNERLEEMTIGLVEVDLAALPMEPSSDQLSVDEYEGRWLWFTIRDGLPADAEYVSSARQSALRRIFGQSAWPMAIAANVRGVLATLPRLEQAVTLDVGHGSAHAMADDAGLVRLYSDVGAATRFNAASLPPGGPRYCACADPIIVLSHWDYDHWRGIEYEPALLPVTWLVPVQPLKGPTHSRVAARVLNAGGRMLPIKRSSRPRVSAGGVGQSISIGYCTGKSTNDSGLLLTVTDLPSDSLWAFPGDADYATLPWRPKSVTMLAAAHHGAARNQTGQPLAPTQRDYARLIYSVGLPNRYGHPSAAADLVHQGAGWLPQQTVHTATGAPVARHAVAVGWFGPPLQAKHLVVSHGVVAVM